MRPLLTNGRTPARTSATSGGQRFPPPSAPVSLCVHQPQTLHHTWWPPYLPDTYHPNTTNNDT